MLKFVVASLCGMSICGSVYMAGWGDCCISKGHGDHKEVAVKQIPAGVIDMKNTRCMVMGDTMGEGLLFVTYQGKAYHICCESCEEVFLASPEKYVKMLEADPEKYGLKKDGVPAVAEKH